MSSSVQPVGSAGGPGDDPGSVDPAAKPVRRSFTAEYRARVVAEYTAAPHGEKSAVLRREGLYQSQIREWTQCHVAKVDLAVCAAHRRGVTGVTAVTGVISGRGCCCVAESGPGAVSYTHLT